MSVEHILSAIHTKLFADSAIVAAVSSRIEYARGPIGNTWPQIHYFEVASTQGYLADYDSVTIQFSTWTEDRMSALRIGGLIRDLFSRFRGKVSITGGIVDINWSELIDSGALPETDLQLFGNYHRFTFRYRGENLGGY